MSFRTGFYKLLPSWLSSGEGELVAYSITTVVDAFLERIDQGTKARFPSLAPLDALSEIGRDRQIRRGFDEPADSYRVRLLRWLDDWKRAGSPYAVIMQLRGYFTPRLDTMRIVSNSSRWHSIVSGDASEYENILLQNGNLGDPPVGNWNWDGNRTNPATPGPWSRFWMLLYPDGLWDIEGDWDDGISTWGDGGSWGTTATLEQVSAIRSIVAQWKGAHARCPWIVVAFDAALFEPTDPAGSATQPDGTWGTWHKLVPIGDPPTGWSAVASRSPDARYWSGTDGHIVVPPVET